MRGCNVFLLIPTLTLLVGCGPEPLEPPALSIRMALGASKQALVRRVIARAHAGVECEQLRCDPFGGIASASDEVEFALGEAAPGMLRLGGLQRRVQTDAMVDGQEELQRGDLIPHGIQVIAAPVMDQVLGWGCQSVVFGGSSTTNEPTAVMIEIGQHQTDQCPDD